jgi:hypothetical protein
MWEWAWIFLGMTLAWGLGFAMGVWAERFRLGGRLMPLGCANCGAMAHRTSECPRPNMRAAILGTVKSRPNLPGAISFNPPLCDRCRTPYHFPSACPHPIQWPERVCACGEVFGEDRRGRPCPVHAIEPEPFLGDS